jgi:hypothetical protein
VQLSKLLGGTPVAKILQNPVIGHHTDDFLSPVSLHRRANAELVRACMCVGCEPVVCVCRSSCLTYVDGSVGCVV